MIKRVVPIYFILVISYICVVVCICRYITQHETDYIPGLPRIIVMGASAPRQDLVTTTTFFGKVNGFHDGNRLALCIELDPWSLFS